VCRRSTTTCASCVNFQRGVAGGLGLCARAPRRLALRGTELRACWEAADILDPAGTPPSAPIVMRSGAAAPDGEHHARTFVLVDGPDAGVAVVGSRDARPAVVAEATAIAEAAAIATALGFADGEGVSRPAPAARVTPRRIPGGWSLWGDFET
jgi:hypothetical protein